MRMWFSKLNANIRMGSCHCWHGQDRKPLVTMPPMPGALAEAAEKAINKDPGDSEEHMAELLKAWWGRCTLGRSHDHHMILLSCKVFWTSNLDQFKQIGKKNQQFRNAGSWTFEHVEWSEWWRRDISGCLMMFCLLTLSLWLLIWYWFVMCAKNKKDSEDLWGKNA